MFYATNDKKNELPRELLIGFFGHTEKAWKVAMLSASNIWFGQSDGAKSEHKIWGNSWEENHSSNIFKQTGKCVQDECDVGCILFGGSWMVGWESFSCALNFSWNAKTK